MKGMRHPPKQIIRTLRTAEQLLNEGQSPSDSVMSLGYRTRPTSAGSSWAKG